MLRRIGRVSAWIGLLLLPALLGVIAFFGTAKITSSMVGLVAGALLVQAAVAYGFARLVRTRALVVIGVHAVVLSLAIWLLLFRRPSYESGRAGDRGLALEAWQLSTGSTVGIARLGTHDPGRAPLIFLHGGPGFPLRELDGEFLRGLSAQGLEVVVFEQAGVGESPHLPIGEYTLARAVADVEAVRVRLDVERLSLLGQSWGAILASEYLTAHPDRVERIVLTSPGPIDKRFSDFDVSKTAAAKSGDISFSAPLVALYVLQRLNLDAALAFMPREEADARALLTAAAGRRRSICAADGDFQFVVPKGGADLFQIFQLKREIEGRAPATPTRLVPTLVVRGGCDFMRHEVADDYVTRLGGTLFEIPDVGHSIWPKRSALLMEKIVAFLATPPISAAP